MKDFHCRDIGMNCEFVAKGNSPEEILTISERHAEQVHSLKVTPELEEKLKWLIHDETSPMHRESVARNS